MAPSQTYTLTTPPKPHTLHLGFHLGEARHVSSLQLTPTPTSHQVRKLYAALYVASNPLGSVLLSPPILELNPQTREAVTARYSRDSHSTHSISGHLEATRGFVSGRFCVDTSFHPYFLALRYRANPFQNRLHQLRRKSRGERPQPTACCPIAKRSPRGLARLLYARLLYRCVSSAFPALV
jgi:hypothetical protein